MQFITIYGATRLFDLDDDNGGDDFDDDCNDDVNGGLWVAKKILSVISKWNLVQWPCSIYLHLIVALGFSWDSPNLHRIGTYNQERIVHGVKFPRTELYLDRFPFAWLALTGPRGINVTLLCKDYDWLGLWFCVSQRIARSVNSPWRKYIQSCSWAAAASL